MLNTIENLTVKPISFSNGVSKNLLYIQIVSLLRANSLQGHVLWFADRC